MLNNKYVYSPEDIGALIRLRRKKLGYTQTEIAEANGCSVRFISELERGKPGAGIGQVIRIANSIGLDVGITERGSAV